MKIGQKYYLLELTADHTQRGHIHMVARRCEVDVMQISENAQ